MILQALTRYYDILAEDPESGIPLYGYSVANVSYALNLSEQGELLDIFPLFRPVQRGNSTKELPLRMVVPEQVKRSSGVAANFLCDNSAYVLGFSAKETTDKEYALKRFQAFRKLNKELLSKVDCIEAKAVIAFLDSHDPVSGKENPVIAAHFEGLMKGGNLVFKLDNHSGFIHECADICRLWEENKSVGSEYIGQCLITGETAPIARLHSNLKGIQDANPTGATLVGFNARAYESYNRTEAQGLNSPVSERAAFAYTTVLNHLLSPENENRKFVIGDATVVYWAESKQSDYAKTFMNLFEPELDEGNLNGENRAGGDQQAEQRLRVVANKVKRAHALDQQYILDGLDRNTRFYILGLAPNAARISVRFFHTDIFERIVQKIMAHYTDMQMIKEYADQPTYLSVGRILDETVLKTSKNPKAKPSPLMAGAVFRSILENNPYPAALFYAILNRVRADHKVNYVRAAVIKAYLLRKYRNQPQNPIQEVLCMPLNEQSTNQAYLLGRLFAVLEKAQKEAVNPTATIKDRYFTSACASPSTVFPILLRLSQHHISKAEYGYMSDKRIEEIMNRLDVENNPIPAHLSLDQQGIFVLGYYHQRAAFYIPKNNSKVAEEPTLEN